MPQVMQDDGPVLVEFYLHPVEDRGASKKAGHYVGRDVEFVRITPAGGNLIVEREVSDIDKARFERQYKAWKEGVEPPLDGTSLKEWPPITPAQIKMMDSIHIRTVEALAKCSDGALQHAGMGAVALREKARTYLDNAENHGKVAEQVETLKTENASLRERLEQLEQALADLKPRRGRPPKERSDAA